MRHINRRTILRGAGVALTLPLLPSLFRGRAARAQEPSRRCLVLIGHPNGTTQTPGSPEIPEGLLQRLAPLEGRYNLVRNINNNPCKLGQYDSGVATAHSSGFSGFLAGEPLPGLGAEIPTFDQILADDPKHQGARANSIAINVNKRPSSAGGVPNDWYNTWSWRGPMQPVPSYHDPRVLFEDLFTDFTPPTDPAVQSFLERRRAVLDGVLDQIHVLEPKLGQEDRIRLDQYLTSVNELDAKTKLLLEGGAALQCEIPQAPEQLVEQGSTFIGAGIYPEVLAQMQSLVALALQCDATRIVTFLHASPAGAGLVTSMSFVPGLEGAVSGWHPLSHWNSPYGALSSDHSLNRRDFERVTAWHYDRVVDFVSLLDSVPNGVGGTLLDEVLVCFGSWMGAATHNCSQVHQILFGGGDRFVQGQDIVANPGSDPGPRSIGDLWLTVMRAFDMDVQSVGEGTAGIDELLA